MRKNLRLFSLLLGTSLLTTFALGQADRFAYVITDIQKEGSNWSYLRKFDLRTSEYSQVLLNGIDAGQVAYEASSKKQIQNFPAVERYGFSTQPAFNSGVAAIAYDRRNNRLYYTPMFIDQLRYIDLRSMKVFYVTDQPLTGMAEKSQDQGNIVTRMVIASDGYGYALTNDATHLIRFNTGRKLTIEDLGTIVDAQENKGVSIHNSCSSFGGDVIADNDGNLYVISARNHVFKINIESKVATHLGAVTGLPANYTINGAAVDDNNKLIVSSAVNGTSYFTVDPKTLVATAYRTGGEVWRSSDLANSNLLNTKKTTSAPEIASRSFPAETGTNKIQVFPNPVVNNEFKIVFSQLEAGSYTLKVTDVMGREVVMRNLVINAEEQTENVKLDPSAAKGVYLIKVTDKNNTTALIKKILVQ